MALPQEVDHWSLITLREKLIKIGAKVARHGRYVMFQLAEEAVDRRQGWAAAPRSLEDHHLVAERDVF